MSHEVTIRTEVEVSIYEVRDIEGNYVPIDYVETDSDGDLIVHLEYGISSPLTAEEVRDWAEANTCELLNRCCDNGLASFINEALNHLLESNVSQYTEALSAHLPEPEPRGIQNVGEILEWTSTICPSARLALIRKLAQQDGGTDGIDWGIQEYQEQPVEVSVRRYSLAEACKEGTEGDRFKCVSVDESHSSA